MIRYFNCWNERRPQISRCNLRPFLRRWPAWMIRVYSLVAGILWLPTVLFTENTVQYILREIYNGVTARFDSPKLY